MQEFEEKIHKAIKDEYVEKISKHEVVIGDSDNGIQATVSNSRKITLTNGDVIIYIKNS